MAHRALWAPWRMAYIGAPKSGACIFCDAPAADPQAALVLAASAHAVVMLNRYPYANGHLMVAPRAHTADLGALEATAYAALSETLRRAVGLLQSTFRPDGMNVGLNLGAAAGAGFAQHLHWHLVPRWNGDTNFMPVIAEVSCLPEHLDALWARLRPVFAPLDG
ncbi:HIT domain-containing protein [bacterium]|nr:HIT domain-containing protein [bacterium]